MSRACMSSSIALLLAPNSPATNTVGAHTYNTSAVKSSGELLINKKIFRKQLIPEVQ